MRTTNSLYHIGHLDKAMNTETKAFIYKTNCRPSPTYEQDLKELNEKTMKCFEWMKK